MSLGRTTHTPRKTLIFMVQQKLLFSQNILQICMACMKNIQHFKKKRDIKPSGVKQLYMHPMPWLILPSENQMVCMKCKRLLNDKRRMAITSVSFTVCHIIRHHRVALTIRLVSMVLHGKHAWDVDFDISKY